MKYMVIIYGNQQLWESMPDREALIADFDAFVARHYATGELIGAYGVAEPDQAKTVRVRDGELTVTDGPYLETKEHLASWYLLDVDSEQRALQIAGEVPAAALSQVEVWPVPHEGRR